jgi:methionyl-tRNA formyltransferase
MLLREAIPIGPRTTAADLHDALAAMGARLILRALAEDPPAVPQPGSGATYAPKLSKEDARLDWSQDAAALDRRVRGLNPWPGTVFEHAGTPIRLLAAEPAEGVAGGGAAPGTVLDGAPTVACGAGTALCLLRLQRPGRAPLPAPEFLRGFALPPGTALK